MAANQLENVVSHWHKLIENFQTSPIKFYADVEEALRRRGIPELKSTQVAWEEGGILSPRREYLRIFGEHHVFDVCAAPFGSGFFFSSWVSQQKAQGVLFLYLLFVTVALLVTVALSGIIIGASRATGLFGSLLGLGLGNPFVTGPISVLVVMWGVALLARAGQFGPERAMLTIPLLGWFYARTFAPPTFYRLDTMYMFQSAVQSAIQEVINGLLVAKGRRSLNEGEFKPIERQLVGGRAEQPPAGETRLPDNAGDPEAALPDGQALLELSQRRF